MTNKEIFGFLLDINKYKLGTNRLFPYDLYGGMIGDGLVCRSFELGTMYQSYT
jgi:hypothetical protein